jgi:CRP/FNR family transcriptional regulator
MSRFSTDTPSLRQTAIAAILRQTHLFANLPPEDMASVVECCVIKNLQKGESLFREGQNSEGFYIVQSGAINVYRITPDGREQIICVFNPPDTFAEVTLATTETYPANAVALEPSQVILLQKNRFRDLILRHPKLSLQMIASMSLHLKHLVQTIQDIKGRQIEYRLADWLLKQAPDPIQGRALEFTLPISKKILDGQLGVTSETLSRTFAKFRKEQLICLDGSRIEILGREGLQAYLES